MNKIWKNDAAFDTAVIGPIEKGCLAAGSMASAPAKKQLYPGDGIGLFAENKPFRKIPDRQQRLFSGMLCA
ncbi:hypothetical protein [Methylomicrobium agile]|uniref:hypothetical protein n=1 Tax=Methylomicrobium agile TaxID=39774 RepID=UPI0004DF922E|nr:hypothetical protein [Methylomicrobium agile]